MSDPRITTSVAQRLSLRTPQVSSLRLLADVLDIIEPSKTNDVVRVLEKVRAGYPDVQDFERDFPSLCFALATGVGKTRLAGAFIAYLYLMGVSRHFFMLAPNLTIYEKLIEDFRQGSAKYVFKGISEFVTRPPLIITGDNYEEGRGVRGGDMFGDDAIHINIFNISKINSEVRGGKSPRIKRLHEYIGQSYFEYLAGLDDLVLIMDEAHRYRGTAGARAIAELKPILGLELTATPMSVGAKPQPFKNVIYRYGLAQAMSDGFVKEPAVATRADFNPVGLDKGDLEKIMLEDGIHYHEHVRAKLETYALTNRVKRVHPFMLVVASDTTEAKRLREYLESDEFFEGRYRGRVAEIHSKQTGAESDENAEKLLEIETSGKTDIVVHVNMLKEGWDVTNLYTIVPLRASASEILTEQTLGRGLRLPYGRRTGEPVIDTLTVIAHDRFQAIIDEARKPDSLIRCHLTIGEGGDVPTSTPKVITAPSVVESWLAKPLESDGAPLPGVANAPARFETDDERDLAEIIVRDVLPSYQSQVKHIRELRSPTVQRRIIDDAMTLKRARDGLDFRPLDTAKIEQVGERVLKVFEERTIAIPQLVILPVDRAGFGFRKFDLERLDSLNYQPGSRDLLIQNIRTDERHIISSVDEGAVEERLEDYLLRRLVDFDEVDYEEHAELLYHLAGQIVTRLRSYLPDDTAVRNVLITQGKGLAEFVHAQMVGSMWREEVRYRVEVRAGFTELRPQHFDMDGSIQDFRLPSARVSDVKRTVYGGFKKACYPVTRFDSDPERRLAMLLERENAVRKWMRPGPGQFRIEDSDGNPYQPDFVAETDSEHLIIEPKRQSEISDEAVRRKTASALVWTWAATEHHAKKHNGKPWRYLIIPDTVIGEGSTLQGLRDYTREPDLELISRIDLAA
jgi:type III restriction enzyme